MPRHVISIRQIGEEVSWMLIQQALGMPDVKMNSDFLTDRVVMLLFSKTSLPERLCCTAAVRQMGGTTIYEGSAKEEWQCQEAQFQTHLMPIFGYYLDCMYIYGIHTDADKIEQYNIRFPVINAGGCGKHPVHALADMACILFAEKKLKNIETCWIGCDNGTLHSLMELMSWFSFGLKISMPHHIDKTDLKRRIQELKINAEFVDSPKEAVKNCQFIYAGRRDDDTAKENSNWAITQEIMQNAAKNAKLLLSASPIRAIPIDKSILSTQSSMLIKQAQLRLAVHKRILHWVFEKAR